MKFATWEKDGKPVWGLVTGSSVTDGKVTAATGALAEKYPTLKAAIAAGALAAAGAELAGRTPDGDIGSVALLPVIPDPGKLLCVGLNYEMHRAETGRAEVENPTIFTRWGDSQVGHARPMVKPKVSDRFDYEGELAVIIGKRGRHVSKADAYSIIAGYACFNDGSIRDWQRHTTQFTPGKNFLASGAFGPWMVTADEIADPKALTLETRLNGEVMQHTTTDLMIFDIPRLIEYITTFTQLNPGDVIATGTPGGVGAARTPPVFMKAGDVCEVEISKVGLLRNEIVAEG